MYYYSPAVKIYKFPSIERNWFSFRCERLLPRFQGFSPSLFLKRVGRVVSNLVKELNIPKTLALRERGFVTTVNVTSFNFQNVCLLFLH